MALGTGAVFSLVLARGAAAAWPPPPDATRTDLRNPASWPDDPLYGYAASSDPLQRKDGQWELYSFIPDRSVSVPAAPAREVAAGLSVDLAWRRTQGSDRTLIAIAGTGIAYDEVELFARVELNRGELASPPLHADQSACAPLDPTTPEVDAFDCDGDGRATVLDYAHDPRLWPETLPVPGDVNGNGWFDPQDLIAQAFLANATDDDENGYVDDLIGWDFVDDDNDPFDAGGTGLGTREALAAVAEANDGLGGAGVCPSCRLLPLRVARGTLADPQTLALATVYARDRRAQVLGLASEGLAASTLLEEAIDYAHRGGVLVVAATGPTTSRRQSVPAALPHVLGVGAITLSGAEPGSTTAKTFLAASPCSGYGVHRDVSVPARACPGSIVGLTAGVAGLVVAATGLDAGPTPSLGASELSQLLTTSATDIDVLESREVNSPLAWSQSGFEPRFGHGRVDADGATELASRGLTPPVVELTDPRDLTPLYADQVTSPIPVRGSVSAPRAATYDYRVEWAPGVRPLESDFVLLTEALDTPSSVVAGADAPLAELDIRAIDVTHPLDSDSALGENASTITLRLRATAHYADGSDSSGEARLALTVQSDASVVQGFPLRIGASVVGGPKLVDLNDDGSDELVVATTDGELLVYSVDAEGPQRRPGFPVRSPARPGTVGPGFTATDGVDPERARDPFIAAPAIGDLDGDGDSELVAVTLSGTLVVVDDAGRPFPGWPATLPGAAPCPPDDSCDTRGPNPRHGAVASPVLEDLDGDGALEIIQATLGGGVVVYTSGGTRVASHALTEDDQPVPLLGTPVVADLDADGSPDLIVPTSSDGGVGHYLALGGPLEEAPAAALPGWPVGVTSLPLPSTFATSTPGSAAAADFDRDGALEVVVQGDVSVPYILPAAPEPQASADVPPPNALPVRDDASGARGIEYTGRFGVASSATPGSPFFALLSAPSLGDLDQDGTPDVVTAGASRDVAETLSTGVATSGPGESLLAFWSGKTGAMLPGSPAVVAGSPWYGDAAIADLTGDGYPEIIVGTDGFLVHAVDACGQSPDGWPKATGQWVSGSPAVGDLDGDDQLDVVVVTRSGWVFAWHTAGTTEGTIAWASQHHDNRNTGSLATPLARGTPRGASVALPVDAKGACLAPGPDEEPSPRPTPLYPTGGCGCRATREAPSAPGAALVLVLGTAWLRRARRRSRS